MVGGAGVVAGLVLCNIVVVKIQTSPALDKTPTLARHTQLPTVALAKPWWLTSSRANSHLSNTLPAGTLEVCSCRLLFIMFIHLLQQQEAELAAQSVSCLKLCYLTLPLSIFISSIFYQTDNCNICSRYFTYFAKILENSEQCNAFILVPI